MECIKLDCSPQRGFCIVRSIALLVTVHTHTNANSVASPTTTAVAKPPSVKDFELITKILTKRRLLACLKTFTGDSHCIYIHLLLQLGHRSISWTRDQLYVSVTLVPQTTVLPKWQCLIVPRGKRMRQSSGCLTSERWYDNSTSL